MKHLATCYLLICFHGDFHWLNISPVFPGLVQTPSGLFLTRYAVLPPVAYWFPLVGQLWSAGGGF